MVRMRFRTLKEAGADEYTIEHFYRWLERFHYLDDENELAETEHAIASAMIADPEFCERASWSEIEKCGRFIIGS